MQNLRLKRRASPVRIFSCPLLLVVNSIMRLLLVLALALAVSAQAPYDYSEVLEKSLLFYEAQRSGPLPADNRIDWRADSTLDDQPTGGYFDGMLASPGCKFFLESNPSLSLQLETM